MGFQKKLRKILRLINMMDLNVNKKNLILGIIGSAFMMAGDLTLSLITPCDNDT